MFLDISVLLYVWFAFIFLHHKHTSSHLLIFSLVKIRKDSSVQLLYSHEVIDSFELLELWNLVDGIMVYVYSVIFRHKRQHSGGILNWCNHYGKHNCSSKIENRSTIKPSKPISGYLSKETPNINSKRYIQPYVYCSIVYNSKDMEATCVYQYINE